MDCVYALHKDDEILFNTLDEAVEAARAQGADKGITVYALEAKSLTHDDLVERWGYSFMKEWADYIHENEELAEVDSDYLKGWELLTKDDMAPILQAIKLVMNRRFTQPRTKYVRNVVEKYVIHIEKED